MDGNERVIRDFIAAWSRMDADALVGFFTEDGVYHNMMLPPVKGRAALKPYIARFLAGWSATEWDALNVLARGDLVIAERLDRTVAKDGRKVDLPCCGVFEMRDGRIAVWRDYFDMGTYAKALG
ncbi:MAG: nuclear transport factor 2 family protein [Rhodospirillales bacterium]|nr:MAG: nuclear transport factor 2 family protein [Rhodospirillales bacterium]